ncbi:MAG: NADH-quinone oxidoreductase subunit C [Nitrososphaeria archaeon]|jgi:Ni,Fe-hydrogenase III component G
MSSEEEVFNELKNAFGEKLLDHKVQKRRVFIQVSNDVYKDVVKFLVNSKGIYHLEMMTGTELKDGIEVMAHMGLDTSISIRTTVSKDEPKLPSICDVTVGAEFYEREIHDLLGVTFEGHPNPVRFVLSSEWPENVHPLRKSYVTKHNAPLREGVE